MTNVQISPDAISLEYLPLQQGLLALFVRSAAMGVLRGDRITAIGAPSIRRLVDALQEHQLLRAASVNLTPLLRSGPLALDEATARQMTSEVSRLVETLEDSPSPTTEWPTMREVLGDDLLGSLVGVAGTSIRRYAARERETPQQVAERLHWLAMVVADLAGGYNEFGIRRWFERPRAQLGGRSPRQTLGNQWSVDDESASKVRALAAALSGAQPLAA